MTGLLYLAVFVAIAMLISLAINVEKIASELKESNKLKQKEIERLVYINK